MITVQAHYILKNPTQEKLIDLINTENINNTPLFIYTISNNDYENETIDNPFITSNFMEDPVNWSKETSTIADRLVGYRQHIDSLNTFNFKTNFNGGFFGNVSYGINKNS